MPEHYTKNTLECTAWCNRCGRPTQHRVDDGRRGPCLACITKRETEAAEQKERDEEEKERKRQQRGLFE
jgi:hypothetical protein